MYGINNFVSSFLMSIELQQTIGYGERAPTDEVSLYILQTQIPLNSNTILVWQKTKIAHVRF